MLGKIALVTLTVIWVVINCFECPAQALDEANMGGEQTFIVRPNETSQRRLTFFNDPNNIHEHNQPPVDSYTVTRLIPGKQYKIRIERIDGSIASWLTIMNRATGRTDLFSTWYEELITANKSSHGPIQIWLLNGLTSQLTGFVTIVYKISIIPQDPLERNDIIRGVNELLPDGTLIKTPTNPTVYLIENGVKRGFPSKYHFESWFMGRWELILLVSDNVVSQYPTGSIMPFKDGTLLKFSDRSSDQTVFVIEGSKKRAFQSWEDFIGMGYAPQNIKAVPGQVLDSIPRGSDMTRRILIAGGILTSPAEHTIKGKVTDANGSGMGAVTVGYSATASTGSVALNKVTTDSNGFFTISNVRQDLDYTVTPTRDGSFFSPRAQHLKRINGDRVIDFVGAPSPSKPPKILSAIDSSRAIAVDSVTMVRDPLALRTPHNLSSDQITRIMIFATELNPPAGLSPWDAEVSVFAKDQAGFEYEASIENIAPVPKLDGVTQVSIQLPMEPEGAGQVSLRIKYRGTISNSALVTLKALKIQTKPPVRP